MLLNPDTATCESSTISREVPYERSRGFPLGRIPKVVEDRLNVCPSIFMEICIRNYRFTIGALMGHGIWEITAEHQVPLSIKRLVLGLPK